MCGIAGVIGADGPSRAATVTRQVRMLDHRGPDAHGVFVKPRAALAQNRLAVIDLVTGDPPITDESGDLGAVLNGEIYNFRDLRTSLQRDGHRLSTRGDTEVLAHLAEEHEPVEVARRLDGMFAFAVWDDRRGRLTLGRDRLGKKPLYYTMSRAGDLVFASEIKGLFAHEEVSSEIDESVIPAYLQYGYVPTPRTFFRGVRALEPGHVLVFEPHGEPRIERYWEPPLVGRSIAAHGATTLDAAAKGVRARLEAAVERRMIADVPLGAFLSGGIDSSAVVGIAARVSGRSLSTFTIGFDDHEGFDERPHARMVAEKYRTDHHEFVVQPDAVDLVERLVWHHDQPFGDASAVPTYLLSQLTKDGVTVALSGDGGDELFAGYERFLGGLVADRYSALPGLLRQGVSRTLGLAPAGGARSTVGRLRRFADASEGGLPDAYLSWISFVVASDRERLIRSATNGTADVHHEVWRDSAGATTLDRLLDLNLRTYLLDDLLPKVDRMSMAHGLEVRSPFLDIELLDYAVRLRPALKLRGRTLKRVLKAAVSDIVPPEITQRPKRGFGVPLDRWFREDLRSYVQSSLGAPDARLKEYLSGDAVDAMLAEHDRGARNLGYALWTLLTLEIFLRERSG